MDKKTLLRKLREDLELKLNKISEHLDKCEEANIEFENAFINLLEIGLETSIKDTDTIDEIFDDPDHEYYDEGLTIYKNY